MKLLQGKKFYKIIYLPSVCFASLDLKNFTMNYKNLIKITIHFIYNILNI